MKQRPHVTPELTAHTFGDDPWTIRETGFEPSGVAWRESLFALGNGQLGIRGDFEEGYPQPSEAAQQSQSANARSVPGTYWNGLYVRRPIAYGESAPGFPQWGDFMPALMNARELELQINGQALKHARIETHERSLHLQTGLLDRRTDWRFDNGDALTVRVETLVSFTRPGLVAQRIRLQAEERTVALAARAWLRPTALDLQHGDDPRISAGAQDQLIWQNAWSGDNQLAARQQAVNAYVDALVRIVGPSCQAHHHEQALSLDFQATLAPHETLEFTRLALYRRDGDAARMRQEMDALAALGFDGLRAEQERDWQSFWRHAALSVPGQALVEQGLRFNLFQLRQSCSRDESANIAAKGLSGPGYDGHYFWDSEIYVLPLFSLLDPATARALLRYRIRLLPAARTRARQMSHPRGALYPWRTISGDECSAFFPAGTAQYHINADIAYAVQRYLRDSGDEDFVLDEAAEMVLETARIWMDLGHFNPHQGGHFTIHEVTGPDEYTALVDNNYYTNLLAARHLGFAAHIAERLSQRHPQQWQVLCANLALTAEEVANWRRAADRMFLPVDIERDLSWQDDRFMQRPAWDYARHPASDVPMLLKHHPMVLYRHQILKQADVLMAHYLCPEHSSLERKTRDFAFYEPLTTHDSSLSPCVHSIIAAWIGSEAKALDYFHQALRSDLDDLHGNTHHGLHIASMAGSLACLYHGFAGLHSRHLAPDETGDTENVHPRSDIHLSPVLPPGWNAYTLRFSHCGSLLELTVQRGADSMPECHIRLLSGPMPKVFRHGHALTVTRADEARMGDMPNADTEADHD